MSLTLRRGGRRNREPAAGPDASGTLLPGPLPAARPAALPTTRPTTRPVGATTAGRSVTTGPTNRLRRMGAPTWSVVAQPARDGGPERFHVLVSDDDLPPQATPGDRFHHVFDQRCAAFGAVANRHPAIDYGPVSFSYTELREFSNQLARFLRANGVRRGHRVAVLMDRSIYSHATVLALSRLDAVCVPLDPGFPDDRIRFMLDDAAVLHAVTLSRFLVRFAGPSGADAFALDQCLTEIRRYPTHPIADTGTEPGAADAKSRRHSEPTLRPAPRSTPPSADDPICYIIYTSGSTGRPKGVPIRHTSIVNFLRVAADLYGYRATDRVYNGMTIAFDFSMEELWVPLASGATLVPAPADAQLVGDDLADLLVDRGITALCCVPTLLGTLSRDVPQLRLLIVSGEACPPDLAERWLAPHRRMLNLYGPTETTVTATWTVMDPDRPVTIGGPLPTYTIAILDPERPQVLPAGEVGEIAVAGIGVADGYLNRPEKTAEVFVDDLLGLADNPGGRLYRTGDLGRINDHNEIEFLGRIDTQVKIRGYRIELDEIAAAARTAPTVGNAVVDVIDGPAGTTDLVAYLTPSDPGGGVDVDAVHSVLRDRLPAYMLPTYYECLDTIPLLPSTKVDRAALPAPAGPRFVGSGREHVPPRTGLEASLTQLLATTLGLESVSVEADFFDDLGADSLVLAGFATAIRSELQIKRVSIRKLYEHPSVRQLAAQIEPGIGTGDGAAAGFPARPGAEPVLPETPSTETDSAITPQHEAWSQPEGGPGTSQVSSSRRRREPRVPSTAAYVATGVAQVLAFLAVTFAGALAGVWLFRWAAEGSVAVTVAKAPLAGLGAFVTMSGLFTGLKWLAVGRFTTEPVPLWTPAHLRFWVASTAVRAHPMNLFLGTPAYNLHLRLLGASVGPDAVVLARTLVCTDLIEIGNRTVVREDCQLQGYTARDGWLFPGRVTIGADSYLSAATVLDIDSSVGTEVQVGLASAVLEGQHLESHRSYQGSPAQPSSATFNYVPALPANRGRAWRFALLDLLIGFGIVLPASAVAAVELVDVGVQVAGLVPNVVLLIPAKVSLATVLLLSSLVGGLVTVGIVPRLAHLFLRPHIVYPLFSVRYRLARAVTRFSNNRLLNTVFGDSAMILGYLRWVGYDLRRATQTGSNFGIDQRHHSPFLCSFDRNTLVSDGLRLENLELGATSFRLRPVSVPADTYLGNAVRYPAGSTVGPDCLIATKAAVPTDGKLRTHVGILGSPAFEIPRSVARDQAFDHFKQPGVFEARLNAKLRSNLVTMGLFLARSWALLLFTVTVGSTLVRWFDPNGQSNAGSAAAATVTIAASLLFTPLFSIACDWAVRGFRPLQPLYCSLYDRRFWHHERFWKLSSTGALAAFNGTPIKPVLYRLQGARVGAKVYDDGGGFPEPSLVTLGDHVTLNRGATIQSHSLEDGTFKSDRTSVGAGTTLGVRAFVHYGVMIEERSLIDADSFVMKGTTVPAGSHWLGNPARSVDSERAEPADTPPLERTLL